MSAAQRLQVDRKTEAAQRIEDLKTRNRNAHQGNLALSEAEQYIISMYQRVMNGDSDIWIFATEGVGHAGDASIALLGIMSMRMPKAPSVGPRKAQIVHVDRGPAGAAGTGSAANRNVIINESKWDYFFGRVKSNPHNEARSLQNLKDLERLGFPDTPSGREGLTRLFEIGRHLPDSATHTTQYGVTIT